MEENIVSNELVEYTPKRPINLDVAGTVSIPLTEEELTYIEACAEAMGCSVGNYAFSALMQRAAPMGRLVPYLRELRHLANTYDQDSEGYRQIHSACNNIVTWLYQKDMHRVWPELC